MRVTGVAMALCGILLVAGNDARADTANAGNAGISVTAETSSVTKIKKSLTKVKKSGTKKAGVKRRGASSKSHAARRSKYLSMARQSKPSGLPIKLVDAVISMESGYRPNARGSAGEIGLMQIKPATARMVHSLTGVRGGSLSNPATNLRVGMAYLNWCHRKAKGNVSVTIGCYNAGPGNMWKWKKFAVTRKYVRYVHQHLASN